MIAVRVNFTLLDNYVSDPSPSNMEHGLLRGFAPMQIDLERLLTEANDKLAVSSVATKRLEQVEAFRRFLKLEMERLRIRHRFGLGGLEIATGRSYLVDLVLCRACRQAASEIGPSETELESCAVAALGGYGRRELAPFSDVDVLFLHAGRRSKVVRKFVEQVLYTLWDSGLTVGHSFRSVSDCIAMAKEDLHSRNAMSEARHVAGNQHLFRRLVRELDEAVYKNRRETGAYLQLMKREIEARYEKFGRAVCLQEPNVKESAGGLRDMHAVLWVGHARFGCRGLDDLRADDRISGGEYAAARRAYDFIARARNEAHFAAGRQTDLLTLDLQAVVAPNLGYEPKRGLLASERFMRDYYVRASELHQFSRSFLLRAFQGGRERGLGRARPVKSTGSFVIKRGKLQPRLRLSDFELHPHRLIEVFAIAQAEGVTPGDELKLAIRNSLSVVDRSFRASPRAGKAFLGILRYRGRVAATLRAMHETGLLARFLPEFARITFLVQHDFYHKYTIDEHTLNAVEALDRAAASQDRTLSRFGKLFSEIEDAAPLYLGLFLHDIGKGHGGGHVAKGAKIAERISTRLGLDQRSADKVIFLVRHHLLMSHLSQRRDLSEENVIESFAEKVGDLETLNMLTLLTYADTSGVGPGIWNEWKDALLWDLYRRTRAHLTGRPARWDSGRRDAVERKVISAVTPEILPSEVERHFAMMPERYWRATDPDRLVAHVKMIKRLESQSLAAEWHVSDDKHFTDLTVCTRDSAGLFARLAGALSSQGVNILSADLNTREDGVVLDTFRISEMKGHHAVGPDRWCPLERALRDAVDGNLDVAASVDKWHAKTAYKPRHRSSRSPARPAVRIHSEASPVSTVIEVRAEDQPGLAYKISSTLAQLGLNITFAKIATEKNQALDVFYITDETGAKLMPDRIPEVETSLLQALGAHSGQKLMKEAV